jgi:hypothetical protein
MGHVTLGNPSRKDRENRQIVKSGDDSAISQRSAANRSAKDSRIPPLSSSEEINPPGRQEDRNISPTSLPQPDGDAPNLALGSNSSADELPETRSISADPGTNVSRALPTEDGRAPNAAAPTKSARVCDQTKHTIPAGTDQMSAHNPSANKVNPKAKSGNSKKSPKASKIGNLKRAPEQHVKTCAYCKSDQHQVHDCPQSANPRCFSCGSPDHKEKDCPDKVHNAAEDLSRPALPDGAALHGARPKGWIDKFPAYAKLKRDREAQEDPWFRGSDAYTRPYVPPPRSHQHNTEVDLPYARQPGRCDRCGTLHPPQVLHADTGGAHPPTPADFYSANKRTTLLCIDCVHGPDADPSMPTTFASHVVIHDIMPTGTPTGPPPIHPGHRVQVRAHVAGVLLGYVDADRGVILHDNGKIEHVHPSDIRLDSPAPHKQKTDERNSLVERLRNELARTQENLLRTRQQRDDAAQRLQSHRDHQAYTAAQRREHPRPVEIQASKPSSADRPHRGTPRAETNRDSDVSDDDDRDRLDRNDRDGWTKRYSRRDGRPYYHHEESGRSVWAKPIKDADINWDAIWKDVEKVEARYPAARRQDAGKRHNDVYDDRSARMQSDKAERRREEARVKLLIAGPPHADDDEALGSIADYRGAPGSPPPRSPIASDDDERVRTHIDDSRNAHKQRRNKERRTEKRWYRIWDSKWVSEEEARQEDFDPYGLVEVEVDIEDNHGRDDHHDLGSDRSFDGYDATRATHDVHDRRSCDNSDDYDDRGHHSDCSDDYSSGYAD